MIRQTYTQTGIGALTRTQINTEAREAIRETGEEWFEEYLPKHFGRNARSLYRYAPRSGDRGSGRRFRGSYQARKLRQFGHTRPLEFRGDTKRRQLRSKNIKATATSRRARATIFLLQAWNRRNPHSNINMLDEVRTVIPSEERELGEFNAERLDDRLEAAGRRVSS